MLTLEQTSTKVCGRCETELPLAEFSRLRQGHQHWCKACCRAYFQERGELHRRQSGAALRRRRQAARAHVRAILTDASCADCGLKEALVLEFDHVGVKRTEVSVLVAQGAPAVELDREIAQCEMVCANCHRRRTIRRRSRTASKKATVRRNKEVVRRVLAQARCADCGTRDAFVLEFDHVGEKRAAVSTLVRYGYGVETIRREIERCEIRCRNCHRRRTIRENRASRG